MTIEALISDLMDAIENTASSVALDAMKAELADLFQEQEQMHVAQERKFQEWARTRKDA